MTATAALPYEPRPRDFSARLTRSRQRSLAAARKRPHRARSAAVLLAAVAVPAFATPEGWSDLISVDGAQAAAGQDPRAALHQPDVRRQRQRKPRPYGDAIQAAETDMAGRHGKKKFRLVVTQNTPTYEQYVVAPPPAGGGAANMPGLDAMLAGKTPPQLGPENPKKTPVLFIGGFGDTAFGDPERTVSDYRDRFQEKNPDTEAA